MHRHRCDHDAPQDRIRRELSLQYKFRLVNRLDQLDRRNVFSSGASVVIGHRENQDASEDNNAPVHRLRIWISHRREVYHDECEDQEHQCKHIHEKAPSTQ